MDNVDLHIFPYQPPISLPVLLSRSLLVVQPFRSLRINPQISMIETLYAGVPVITTDVESNRELVRNEKTGLIVPPDDVEVLVAAIRRLLEEPDLRERLQSNCAAETKSRWNWNAYGQELLAAYEHAGE
jgi:glycosyltransferase involved in cell wall biosynthesis